MTVLNPTLLGPGIATPQTVDSALQTAADPDRVGAFDAALERQGAVAANTPPSEVNPAEAVGRARETLGLDPVQKAGQPQPGDLILDGLQKLRGNFDASNASINRLMNSSTLDAHAMMEMQVELVRFSLLTDITSKLTGKSTQAFDTLMKGQ